MTMLYVGIGSAAVALIGGVISYVGQKDAANAAANEKNAAGAYGAYQGYVQQYHDSITANDTLDQANQQVAEMKQKAGMVRGNLVAAQGASGANGLVGSARTAQDTVDRLSAVDTAAVIGSAINKTDALKAEGQNAEESGQNALASGILQGNSLRIAGDTSADASLLSSFGSAMKDVGGGYNTSNTGSSTGGGSW